MTAVADRREAMTPSRQPRARARPLPQPPAPTPARSARRLVPLEPAECWDLLRGQHLGRLVYTEAALPAVVPVAFTVVGGEVVVAATPGDKVTAAVRGAVVAFEVDQVDHAARTGWSVTAVGPARVLADPHLAAQLRADGLAPWAPSSLATYLAITAALLRGRRLVEA